MVKKISEVVFSTKYWI